jgi:hypothetical protein
VRVKIDENLPESAVKVVRAAGHDVDTKGSPVPATQKSWEPPSPADA